MHVEADAVERLREEYGSRLILPGDPDYDGARKVYYRGIDRTPMAIAQVADDGEVARVVRIARDTGTPLAVRSGGHSIAGHGTCDGGLVLDLSGMRTLEVDVDGRSAWVEAGSTAGEYTAAVGAHGLATGFGDAPSVGIGGITLGGGVGFLHRRLGLTIDSLLAADVVTADGEVVRTDPEREPDLFWAIRGGGGNFGVATRFRFRLHPVDEVVGGLLMLPATAKVVAGFMAEALEASDALSGMVNVAIAPPAPFIPPEHHGRPIVMAAFVHAGPSAAAERELARFRSLATPIVDEIEPKRYGRIYAGAPEPPPTQVATVRPFFMDGFDRTSAEGVLNGLAASEAPMSVVQLRVLGGAVARVPNAATAFAHRDRAIMASVGALHDGGPDAARHARWADHLAESLRTGARGAYVGFLGGDGRAGDAREAYPGDTWTRLREVKARYDPMNLFRLNQNVPPGSGAGA